MSIHQGPSQDKTNATKRITDSLKLFIESDRVTELRALKVPSGKYTTTRIGFFDGNHLSEMAEQAERLSDSGATGVYFTMNPLNRDCLAVCNNRMRKADHGDCASDADVLTRRAILIDADPKRRSKISATDAEKAFALETMTTVNEHLNRVGLIGGVIVDSGNGYHRYLWVDIPREDADLVRCFLQCLDEQFRTEQVGIDISVHNPSRITKIPGTWARKGENLPDRPHRQSSIVEVLGDERHRSEILEEYIKDHGYEFDGNVWRKKSAQTASSRSGIALNGDERSRASKYVAKMPPSIDGQGGHAALFNAAQALVKGFQLSEDESVGILVSEFNPRCVGPWDEEDVTRKVREVREKSRLQDGYLLNGQNCKSKQNKKESRKNRKYQPKDGNSVTVDDFFAYMPTHSYIFVPSRELWPASSVDARLGENAAKWLDENKPVEQMTWAPGFPLTIENKLVAHGGWIEKQGCRCFNLYLPPKKIPGDRSQAGPWIDHIQRLYPGESEHIVSWLAHRVQRPQEKINHALVLGGPQGIGKDSILEPVKHAIGPWNFSDISPGQLLGRFNGFIKSVILRVSEA